MAQGRMKLWAILVWACFATIPVCAADSARPATGQGGATDSNSPRSTSLQPTTDEAKARLWALACAGVLMERNGDSHETLETGLRIPRNIVAQKNLLSRWWGVEKRADLLECLHSLEVRGHRASFDADVKYITTGNRAMLQRLADASNADRANELRVVRRYYQQLGEKGIVGWDISRYICLCKWGYTVGYLSEDEAWKKIMPAARLLQKKFGSWKELGENYLIGREYWGGDPHDQALCEDGIMRLLESRNSPWVKLPWNTNLGEGPVMGERPTAGGPVAGSGGAK
jgi:hypothetical protein